MGAGLLGSVVWIIGMILAALLLLTAADRLAPAGRRQARQRLQKGSTGAGRKNPADARRAAPSDRQAAPGRHPPAPGSRRVAQVHCRGGRGASAYRFTWQGIRDCNALRAIYGGDMVCGSSCLAQGSCIRVCPTRAIGFDREGRVWVNREACDGCGRCLQVCPTGVMRWVPAREEELIVACSSTDPADRVEGHCRVGCTACGRCAAASPEGGYRIEENLARIDYTCRGERAAGAAACPAHCIIGNEHHRLRR